MEKLGTLKEVKHEWTIPDLLDAHEFLDYKSYVQDFELKQLKAKNGNR